MILIKPPKMPELGNNDPVYSGINGATVFDHRYNIKKKKFTRH
jgi:hypothetical protein